MPLLVGAAGLANALPVELYARPAAAAGAGGGRFDVVLKPRDVIRWIMCAVPGTCGGRGY